MTLSDSEKSTPAKLPLAGGGEIAYRRREAAPGARRPGLIFAGGFRSDMGGTKACFLDSYAAARGLAYLRFDPTGHGASSGRFEEGRIGHWIADLLAVIDQLAEGPQVIVGSSMGAWLALHAALKRPGRIAALLAVAPAPDFTERLIWAALPAAMRAALIAQGSVLIPSDYGGPYPIALGLIEEAREHLLLDAPIALDLPVRLIHGMADVDVPYRFSLDLAERITGRDLQLRLIKDGDHRLSRDSDLAVLAEELDRLYDAVAALNK